MPVRTLDIGTVRGIKTTQDIGPSPDLIGVVPITPPGTGCTLSVDLHRRSPSRRR